MQQDGRAGSPREQVASEMSSLQECTMTLTTAETSFRKMFKLLLQFRFKADMGKSDEKDTVGIELKLEPTKKVWKPLKESFFNGDRKSSLLERLE